MRSDLAIPMFGLLASAAASLNKPLLQPAIPPLDGGLFNNLKPTHSTHDQWEWGWIPDRCRDIATNHNLSPYDIEVFNVHYDDCPDIWIMCRHHNAQVSQAQMIDVFGRLPVRMRSWVRTTIALPGTRSAYTFSDLGDNIYFGDIQNYPTLWAHEIGHTMDHNVVTRGQDFSASQTWLNAYNKDTAISDSYAASNQAENFAQEVVISLFDKVVPGGIGTVESNWKAIYNQYTAAQAALGDNIVPGGKCRNRFENAQVLPSFPLLLERLLISISSGSDIVCMGPAAPCGSQRNAVAPHNVTLSNEVEVIPVPAGAGRKVCGLPGQI